MKETAVALPGSVVAIEYGAFDAPAGMVTGEGTAAKLGFPLTKETLMPPCGAGPVRKTFPLTVAPPWTNAGALKLESEGGKTVIGWLRVTALPVAEIVLTVLVVTGVVAIVKVDEVLPEATVVVAGGVATPGTELDKETLKATGAIAFRVALPAVLLPPTAAVGTVSHEISIGFRVRTAEAEAEL